MIGFFSSYGVDAVFPVTARREYFTRFAFPQYEFL
jgi:hypothetical protein